MKLRILKSKARNFFNVVLKDPRRKNMMQLFYEYSKFIVTNSVVADQYFSKYLYRKGMHNFNDYLLTEKLEYKCWKLNNPIYTSILDNKYLFEQFFSHHNLKVHKSYAYNINSLFFTENKFIQINTIEEFKNFLLVLIKKASDTDSIFIKKKEASCGGKGIYKLTLGDLSANKLKLEDIFKEVIKSSYLFQDTVVQHEQINKLNPYCLNTIRIDTYTNNQKTSKILSSFIRLGIGKSFVDNISSGGVLVGINMENGTLNSEAFSDFTHGKGKTFKIHPETLCKFDDFLIPFFHEAKKLAIDAAHCVSQLKVIGWDIAIQPDGPILIEGNETPGLTFSEIAQKGFVNNPVFLEMLEEIKTMH